MVRFASRTSILGHIKLTIKKKKKNRSRENNKDMINSAEKEIWKSDKNEGVRKWDLGVCVGKTGRNSSPTSSTFSTK